MPKNIDKEKLKEAIRLRILLSDMAPGTTVNEATLADEFGVSRTPVHDVVIVLAAEGVLEYERNHGFRVKEITLRDISAFFELAEYFYPVVVRHAVSGWTDQDMERLHEDFNTMKDSSAPERRPSRIASLRRFMVDLARAGHNDLFVRVMEMLVDRYLLMRVAAFNRARPDMQEHEIALNLELSERLLQAVQARDESAAAEVVLERLQLSKDLFLETLLPTLGMRDTIWPQRRKEDSGR